MDNLGFFWKKLFTVVSNLFTVVLIQEIKLKQRLVKFIKKHISFIVFSFVSFYSSN